MNIQITSGPLPGVGHNNPPKTPFERASEEIEALFIEATAWCDGSGVNTPAEEANVDELLNMLRAAEKVADAARKTENEPFDKGKAEVQARYNPILARAKLAMDACKKALAPYRQKIADEKAAAAEKLRLEAEAKRKAAEEAFRASQVDDLEKRAAAEALLDEANRADKAANKANKAATTGLGLRTSYRPEITDPVAFARYCWEKHRPELLDCMTTLAKRDVAAGLHTLPGVKVHEERSAI